MSTSKRAALSGGVGFVVATGVSYAVSRNRRLSLTVGALSGGATAAATMLSQQEADWNAREEPIRIEVEDASAE